MNTVSEVPHASSSGNSNIMKSVGHGQQPRATPLRDVLSHAARRRGKLLDARFANARPAQHVWGEIEARLVQLHNYVSSMNDSQMHLDIDCLMRAMRKSRRRRQQSHYIRAC